MMKLKGYIFSALLVPVFVACGSNASTKLTSDATALNKQLIADAKHGIHSGDIVLRSGKDFTSYRIRELSDKDKTYSHAGIAYVHDTSVYIYHITPPDLDEPQSDTAMRMEPIEKFADPARCFGFGIVRYQLNEDEINSALHYLGNLYQQKVSFDHFFDLQEDNKMYCSEMVDNTMRYATHGRITLARKYFNPSQALRAAKYFHSTVNEVNKRAYIPIDNIQLNTYCTTIHTLNPTPFYTSISPFK